MNLDLTNSNKVSIIIPSRNTLEYLKWAYDSFRKNNGYEHEIVLLDDASTDGTWEWLLEISKKDKNVKLYRNDSNERLGHTILYDIGIEMASNELCIIGHSDMYYAPMFVEKLLEVHKPRTVISATRIEPPLHPQGPEKIVKDFGINVTDFKEKEFLNFVTSKINKKANITNGAFAPWLISKTDFNEIGGHDFLLAPQSREDSDIFNRFYLNGYKLIQSWNAFVYHLTCRGSRYKDGIGHNSKEWQETNYKGERNFIRKWGSMVEHDAYMNPIIRNKYKIQLVIDTVDAIEPGNFNELLRVIEPWLSQIIIFDKKRVYSAAVLNYISTEQKLTIYDMNERVLYNPNIKNIKEMDVTLFATPMLLGVDNCMFIQMISRILDSINSAGTYEYEHIRIKINKLKRDYYLENIVLDKTNIR